VNGAGGIWIGCTCEALTFVQLLRLYLKDRKDS